MSYVIDLLLVAVFILVAVLAAKRGFFSTLFDLGGYVVGLVSAKILSSSLAPGIYAQYLEEYIRERLTLSLGDAATVDYSAKIEQAVNSIPEAFSGVMELIGVNREQLLAQISEADLSGSNFIDGVMNNIALPIGTAVIRTVLFVVFTIAFSAVLKVVIRLLDKVIKKLPALKQINAGLGFVLGAVKGIIVVIIAALLMGVVVGLTGNESLVKAANDSIIINTVKGLLKSISGYIPA